jgi:serine phosphatase RsbU (regulator of sigma subunit)
VYQQSEGRLLVTVIDGLGGGEEAARAARAAEQVIRAHPERPLQELITQSHAALHSTRGAVIGMLRLDPNGNHVNYIGVGNISIHVYSRQPIKPISKNGILGFRLPTLLELHYTYDPGDIFVLYSDGVSGRFSQENSVDLRQSPQQISDVILARYGKAIDDATVVTVKTE